MTSYGNPFYAPEMFPGVVGNGTNDDTPGITIMANKGRTEGYLNIELDPAKIYTCTNPFIFSGIPVLRIKGNGASWMNIRSVPPPNPFNFNIAWAALVLGSGAFSPNGFNLYSGGNNFGTKIATVAANALSFTTLDASNLPLGDVVLYGMERQGATVGFPPTVNCFEYNVILTAVGGVHTLKYPTLFLYDQQWPEVTYTPPSSHIYGAARALSCSKDTPGGQIQYASLRNINFIKNPNFVGPGGVNGLVQLSGANKLLVDNCDFAFQVSVSMCDSVVIQNSAIADNCELDKMVRLVKLRNNRINQLTAGLGIYQVLLEDTDVEGLFQIAPIDLCEIKRGSFTGLGATSNSRAVVGLYSGGRGPRKYSIRNTHFVASESNLDRMFETSSSQDAAGQAGGWPFIVKTVSATTANQSVTTLTCTRANYDTNPGIGNSIFLGAVFRNATGKPIFRVNRLPYCTGDQFTGDVSMDGDAFGTISIADTIFVPVVHEYEIIDPVIEGPYQNQVTSLWGTAPGLTLAGGVFPTSKVRDKWIKDGCITISSEMEYLPRVSNIFQMFLGHLFRPSMVVIDVLKAAGSPGFLQLKFVDPTGTLQPLFYGGANNGIDLTTVGRRIIDHTSVTVLGGDVPGTISGLQTQHMAALYWIDDSAPPVSPSTYTQPSPAVWSARVYGDEVGQYGGSN